MNKYKVKNFSSRYASDLQMEYKVWIESRDIITVISTNFWYDSKANKSFCTVVYTETDFNL
ncbi:MAG: hypothetical protein ACRC18_06680 [Cetobacterium sp.]